MEVVISLDIMVTGIQFTYAQACIIMRGFVCFRLLAPNWREIEGQARKKLFSFKKIRLKFDDTL